MIDLLNQQCIMEAKPDIFIINEEYMNALPRPSYVERNALKMKIIEKGQMEPIKVNNKMEILDGYTRYDILAERGLRIKYEVRDFDTPEAESDYVVETNVMRRHLNNFQKVETMYKQYNTQKYRNNKYGDVHRKIYIETLTAIKKGKNKSNMISDYTGRDIQRIRETLRNLVKGCYVRRSEKKLKNGTIYEYILLPKAEELLRKKPKIVTTGMIGKIINVDRNSVGKSLYLIDNAPIDILKKLRSGTMTIGKAYDLVNPPSKITSKKYNKILRCPKCNHEGKYQEFK